MHRISRLLLLATFAVVTPAQGQGFEDVEIQTQRLTDDVYMLVGQGGNIGVSGRSGRRLYLDDQFAPLTEKILAAIRGITSESVRFVLNTHWHGDHTGGNENLGEAGALIVAHDNARARMRVEQVLERIGRPTTAEPASPEGALPVVTFTENVTFHITTTSCMRSTSRTRTPTATLSSTSSAPTSSTWATPSSGIASRFIDTATGGSIDGMIAAAGAGLAVMDAETQIIPGHGALSSREDLVAYRDALRTMRNAVAALKEQGLPLEQIQARRPIRAQAEAWGQTKWLRRGFLATIHHGLGGL